MPKKVTRPVRAVAYVRVSTDEQAKEGVSLDMQRRRIATFCADEGLDLAGVYCDDGWSGTDVRRPEFLRLRADLSASHERGERMTLVVLKLDRLSRRQRELMDVIDELLAWDFGFVSVTEQYDTGTFTGRFMTQILSSVNEMEVERIRERTRDGLAEVKAQGRRATSTGPLLGFRPIKGEGLMVVPAEVAIVEQLYRWRYMDRITWVGLSRLAETQFGLKIMPQSLCSMLLRNSIWLLVIAPDVRAAAEAGESRGLKAPELPEGYIQPFDEATLSRVCEKSRLRTVPS